MKTEAGRKKKIETFVAMLERGETIYPQGPAGVEGWRRPEGLRVGILSPTGPRWGLGAPAVDRATPRRIGCGSAYSSNASTGAS
jgi:hypothetical protein